MGRRILNRKDLRADYDAAERRKQDDEETEETDEAAEDEEGDEEEAEEGEEGEADAEAEGEAEGEDGDDDEAPKKKKKKAPKAKPKAAKPKAAKPRSRTRTPKITRVKVVWGVFNNSNQRVATFDYPKRKDADDLAAKLSGDKKSTHFVQPVKEPMEEKKEE